MLIAAGDIQIVGFKKKKEWSSRCVSKKIHWLKKAFYSRNENRCDSLSLKAYIKPQVKKMDYGKSKYLLRRQSAYERFQ